MADIRINALATTAASTASDDFIAVDGSANGTRKLNAYSPTFGGNLTVSGIGTIGSGGTGATTGTLLLSGSSANDTGPYITFSRNSVAKGYIGTASGVTGGSSDNLVVYTSALAATFSGANTTLAGNLTVSGGTITSGSGTLTLNSSANTVVLQSAGTTALTLDSSQNATFAGKVTVSGGNVISGSNWFQASNNSGLLSNLYYSSGWKYVGNGAGAAIYADSSNGAIFATAPVNSGGAGAAATLTTALTIDGSQNATFAGNIKTAAPSGGTAATWRLGTVATVSPTSPNRTIEVEIGGTTYYIHAKTTNN